MAKESFRKARKSGYTIVENEILDDSKVTLEGKGLIAILLSNNDDWEIRMPDIISRSKNGRDAHYNVIWQLIEQGYYARIYIKDKGKHIELVHIFGAVKEDVSKELVEIVNEVGEKGFTCDVEYLMKKPDKKSRKKPVTESQDVEEKPVTDFQDTESSDTVFSDTESQYINNTNRENTNNNNTNIEKPNLNPNLDEEDKQSKRLLDDTLWQSNIPMQLKKWIRVKVDSKSLSISSEQIILLEEAYQYQVEKTYVKPHCGSDDTTGINDYEFSGSIAKMLDTVKDIRNMRGSVQCWVKKAYDFKVSNLVKPISEQSVPFYNWLDE